MRASSLNRECRISMLVTVILVLIAWAVSAAWGREVSQVAPADAAIEWPDTPAGRCAAEQIRAFNTGDENEVRKFESAYRARSALQARSMEERLAQFRELHGQWGRLAPLRIVQSSEHDVTLIVTTANDGHAFEFRYELEKQPPHGLLALYIMGPVHPDAVAASNEPIDDALRDATIEAAARTIKETYVYPEIGAKLADTLMAHRAEGRYAGITSATELAIKLTEDLRAVCNDRHLAVRPGGPGPQSAVLRRHEDAAQVRRENFGFRKVELLPGNVGYMRLDMFHPSPEAQETAAAALAFLANADALIFDLRHNGGGSPEMIRFISSYLFDEPTHLNSFYDRLSDKTSETWTTREIPGRRFASDLPVYVLISEYTFSGAEEFTYNLKHLGRATIVGQTSGGGAHPVQERVLNDRFRMMVPYARAHNPITKTNWEGVGVSPDIAVPADDALDAARRDAAGKLAARKTSG